MKKILISILLMACCFYAIAQTNKTITGKVFDKLSKEPLKSAIITDGQNHTSLADATGKFSITTLADSIKVSFTGYEPMWIMVNASSTVLAGLQPSSKYLDQVIVTANRTNQKRSEAPIAITTITKEVINDTKATRIDQLVNKISGVFMVDLGNEQHQMSIRQPMTTKSLFLYLEDGIPIRTTGLYNHNALLEMNMTGAKQIEVIKGPASSLYGAEAIGGAVNIITQAPPAIAGGYLSAQTSNMGYSRIDGQVGNTYGKVGVLVSGYYANRTDGPIANSDFYKSAITVRADYAINKKTSWINNIAYVDYFSEMFGSLDSAKFSKKDYSSLQTFTYRKVRAIRYKSQLMHQWNESASTQFSFLLRNNSVEQNPSYRVKNITGNSLAAKGEVNESSFNTYALFVQHQQKFKFLNSKLIAGITLDFSPSKYYSNYIDIQRNADGYYVGYTATDSVLSKYSTDITNLASYLHYELSPINRLKITVALRYDYYNYNFKNTLPPSAFTGSPSTITNFNRATPKIGATYNYKQVGFYANYSQGFVPPQISELFQGVKVPYLNAQTFSNYEIGGWASLLKNKLYVDWSLYLLNGTNEIVSVLNPDNSTENKNTGKTKHQGVEYGITYKPNKQYMFRLSASNSKHTFTDYIEKGISYNDNIMAGAPSFLSNAEIMYKPSFIKGFRIGAEWQHQGNYWMDNANTKKYEGFDVLNLRTGYSAKHYEIWLNVLNVLDSYYSLYASKSGATSSYTLGNTREFNIGLSYRFGK